MPLCSMCKRVEVPKYGYCRECFAEYQRGRDMNGYMRERNKNPERREKAKAATARWRERNPEYSKKYHKNMDPEVKRRLRKRARLARYGITEERYDELLRWSNGGCSICGDEPTTIDHDHDTGRVRALLCKRCNHGLGQFKDNPVLLERAAGYLRLFKK